MGNSSARAVIVIILVLKLVAEMFTAISYATMKIAAMVTRDVQTWCQRKFTCQVVCKNMKRSTRDTCYRPRTTSPVMHTLVNMLVKQRKIQSLEERKDIVLIWVMDS